MTMRTPLEPVEGLEISGSVRLEKKLGEGGMGSVWTAHHLALRTQVAVKFLAAHMAQDAAAAARFQREATAAAGIKSPHVVQIFDHGLSPELGPFIVMELLEGETLSAFVQRHGRLSPQVTARILAQLCRALGKAHSQGIVHRDIKPDNVFLIDADRDAFVKVLDFGIAKNLRDELSVTSTGSMMGTPHYMSPEQMLSTKHVDLRADLWATAVLAYHCLTGAVPFDGETFGAVAIAVAQAQFLSPFAQYGVGSPALDAWFGRALSRDLNARFGSADELSDSFARAAGTWSGSAAVTGAVPAVTLGTSFPAPTFNGVANTNGASKGSSRSKAPLIATLGGGAALLVAALVFWQTRTPALTPVAASAAISAVATSASPPSARPAPASPPAADATQAEPPPPAPSQAPATPPAKAPPAPPRRSKNTPPNDPPARPDRGF